MTSLGIGLIGTGYMGKCHALAWNAVAPVFGDVERPRLAVLGEASQDLAEREGARARLRARHRRLALARRRSRRRCRLDHHAQRLPSRDGDRGARGRQACLVREADGDDARRCRAHARGGRAPPAKVAALGYNYIQNPIDPPHAAPARRRPDRRGQSCPHRDGRGFHGRSGGAVLLEERGDARATARSTISASMRLSLLWVLFGGVRRVCGHMAKPYADRPGHGRRPARGRDLRHRHDPDRARKRRLGRDRPQPLGLGPQGPHLRAALRREGHASSTTRSA